MLCAANIDRLHIIPTFSHPFGKTLSPFKVRCEMLEAAMGHLGPRVIIDPIESTLDGVSYTVDTVRAFRHAHPDADLVWVGGADTWRERHSWHQWEALEAMIEPFILGREGVVEPDDVTVQVTIPAISSSEIREGVRRGTPIDHVLPPSVLALIERDGLYQ